MTHLDEPIHLSLPQPDWPAIAERELGRLRAHPALQEYSLAHIGSTAVPGLVAKPVIDLMAGSPAWPPSVEPAKVLEALGSEPLGEAGVSGRLYFRRRGEQSFNLHAVVQGGQHWISNLAIRDYLRESASARARYQACKQAVVQGGATSLLSYSGGKAEFMAILLAEAHAKRGAA